MADSKITGLTSFDSSNTPYWPPAPASDVIPIVDISDNTMAASGTTKKISINNLLSSSPTATGNFTITGDLTVDTSTLRVDSTNNRVGIGTASPSTLCEMRTSGATDGLRVYMNGGGSANIIAAKSFLSPFGEVDRFTVAGNGVCTWSNVGDVYGTSMTLNSTGLGIGVTPSAGKGCLQLSSGINFPATQVASSDANTLDDYEEGTWTPTIKGTTTAGTATYSVQVGTYTKVGRVVYFQGRITWSAHTGTGNMQITGIPFTSLSTTNSNSACNFGYLNNITLTASNVMTGFVFPGTNDIGLYQYPVGGGIAGTVAVNAAADIIFSGTYLV